MKRHPFISKTIPPLQVSSPALWFLFYEDNLLIDHQSPMQPIPMAVEANQLNIQIIRKHYLGIYQAIHCYCAEISTLPPPLSSFKPIPLKHASDFIGDALFNIAGRAIQIINWDKVHQYCGRCGTNMYINEQERAKVCPACNLHSYPRLSPSVIMLVQRKDEILLARSPHFSPGIYSALAGFIEPGETPEEAVEREVMEEVGIEVGNIQYICSQPWPFPDSLMLGFTAEYVSGEITIDNKEIEDAQWYKKDKLPKIPPHVSIAHCLIKKFLEKSNEREKENIQVTTT